MNNYRVLIIGLLFILACIPSLCQKKTAELAKDFLGSRSKIDKNLTTYFDFLLSYYPELRNANLKVEIKRQRIPFTTTPSAFNILRRASNRKYFINVSSGSDSFLEAIIFKNLSDSARFGVLAHELAHVSDFHTQSFYYTIKVLFKHLNSVKLDKFEFETDHIVIKHGLGRFLLSWSQDTHLKLNKADFDRNTQQIIKNERYMSPETVKKYLLLYEL